MTSPYINTKLFTTISLRPDQLDNKIYLNLKKNLEDKIVSKCYKDYGYIVDIFQILNYKDGIIEAENLAASVTFDVEFSCRLCRPLRKKQIICQVNRVNKVLVTTENGPILVIITSDRINDKIFFSDNNNVLRYRKNDTSYILKPKEFVKVTILSIIFNHGDVKIKAMGFLDDVVDQEKDIENFYQDLYRKDKEISDYRKYIEEDNVKTGSTDDVD